MLWMGIQSKLEKVFNFSREDLVSKMTHKQKYLCIREWRAASEGCFRERAQQKQPALQKDLSARRQEKGGAGASGGTGIRVKEEPVSDGEDEPMDTSSSSSALPNGPVFHSISDRLLQDTILMSHCKQILVPFPAQSTADADEQKEKCCGVGDRRDIRQASSGPV
ncbi:hypothetical protein J4Q44_G00278230 [Coregonus suidteri]|uniref:DNA-directed RNA polymerase III subunit RPC5 C-terminal domain-containing protein n=1 Tax=Coregonus suidteri TaxID=861788 RepID=A0AAN8L588_9TELE